jgi:hypothetical protein
MNQNDTTTDTKLELGRYDEAELIELVEADVYGGTGTVCSVTATITAASAMQLCPTTSCTDSC